MFSIKEHSHSRLNILTGEWILVSPHRTKRPWLGKVEDVPTSDRPSYDPSCYLCPGNHRADGEINPTYKEPFVFINDYSTLLHDAPDGEFEQDQLLFARSEKGICKVISFSPNHSLTLSMLSVSDIQKVVKVWQEEFFNIASNTDIKYIQIFENKGEIMGCSNPHPHGQIWSLGSIPTEIHKETEQFRKHFTVYNKSLLSSYLETELKSKERIVLENEYFVALVPFWATWPYETMIISRRHIQTMLDFTNAECLALAEILSKLTIKYDNLFSIQFPYSAGIHQAPVNSGDYPEWHWHMHFYPPLLRSATVKKFMVGYEMMASAQRDLTPEIAAATLQNLPLIHFQQSN